MIPTHVIIYFNYDDRNFPHAKYAYTEKQRNEIILALRMDERIGLIQSGELQNHFEREYDPR